MNKLSRSFRKGFTMIELLVVIAIIGVLAAAVLAAINPIEQINKGRDTARRSNGAELVGAIERYYAVQEKYPWNADTKATTVALAIPTTDQLVTSASTTWKKLTDTDEVKDTFLSKIENDNVQLKVYKDADEDTIYVCFPPTSSQFAAQAETRCLEEASTLPDDACDCTATACSVAHICIP
jgi:prepilin-type N-terminal cleavage/methylation domain-containing protein